jgi:excisionase family DNA binding protein
MPSNPDWLTTTQTMALLGVTRVLVYKLIDSGELPAYQVGRNVHLKRSDVLEFIEACRVEPGTLGHL